jgi:hypothetical protein
MAHVRFGSKADICGAKRHVRFAPNSDRETGFPQKVMSALTQSGHVQRVAYVCFGPEADIRLALHSITLSAAFNRPEGTVRPSVLAVLRLIASSNLVGCKNGKSAGFAPLRIRPT